MLYCISFVFQNLFGRLAVVIFLAQVVVLGTRIFYPLGIPIPGMPEAIFVALYEVGLSFANFSHQFELFHVGVDIGVKVGGLFVDFLDVVGDVAFSVIAVVADGALERFELGVHKKVVEKLDAAVKQLVTVQAFEGHLPVEVKVPLVLVA